MGCYGRGRLEAAGSTQLLVQVADPLSPEAEIWDSLDVHSPYLSDSILLAVINRIPAVSNPALRDLLVGHSPLSAGVLQAAWNRVPAFNASDSLAIDSVQYGVSARRRLAQAMRYLDSRIMESYNMALRQWIDSAALDSAIGWLSEQQDTRLRAELVPLLTRSGQYSLAAQFLDSLDTLTQEPLQLARFERLRLSVEQNGRNWLQLTPVEEAKLAAIASSGTRAALHAQGVQSLINETLISWPAQDFPNPALALPTFSSAGSGHQAVEKSEAFSLYPNPSTGQPFVSLGQAAGQAGEIEVYKADGSLAYRYAIVRGLSTFRLNLEHLANGFYTLRLSGPQGASHGWSHFILQR